jgi:hypothetical protein
MSTINQFTPLTLEKMSMLLMREGKDRGEESRAEQRSTYISTYIDT